MDRGPEPSARDLRIINEPCAPVMPYGHRKPASEWTYGITGAYGECRDSEQQSCELSAWLMAAIGSLLPNGLRENRKQQMEQNHKHLPLGDAVRNLALESCPMHMPGHKRAVLRSAQGRDFRELDITEIRGADDLHRASGILREAMDRTAALYGADRTWFLVNGSTVGILAAVHAAVPRGGEIIAARNCHKSVVHAVGLRGLTVHWVMPEEAQEGGICGPVPPDSVSRLLEDFPDSRAVIITSPTYEGVISDIREIADRCRRAGKILIVDEAHGAHLGLDKSGFFPDGAVHCGADIVVQSAHKLSFGLTQTAYLHMNRRSPVSEEAIEAALDIYETSSPSYPLMISMDEAAEEFTLRGDMIFARWRLGIENFRRALGEPALLGLLGEPENGYLQDPSKLVINTSDAGISAPELAGILRKKYGFETEMACGHILVAMTGPGGDPEDLRRFGQVLHEIDLDLSGRSCDIEAAAPFSPVPSRGENSGRARLLPPPGEAVCTIAAALEHPFREVRMEEAEGGVLAEYLWAYPPGIPLGVPGERVTPELVAAVRVLEASGTEVLRTGNIDKSGTGCVLLLCCGQGSLPAGSTSPSGQNPSAGIA